MIEAQEEKLTQLDAKGNTSSSSQPLDDPVARGANDPSIQLLLHRNFILAKFLEFLFTVRIITPTVLIFRDLLQSVRSRNLLKLRLILHQSKVEDLRIMWLQRTRFPFLLNLIGPLPNSIFCFVMDIASQLCGFNLGSVLEVN